MRVEYGGIVNSTTVINGGVLDVLSGGVANSTTVNGDWYGVNMYVSSGGTANSITVIAGSIYVGGVVNCITLQGNYNDDADGGCKAYIFFGGVANSTTINDEGEMSVLGGAANLTTVNKGGCLCVSLGGVANSTTVNEGGSMYVSSGGTATIVFTPIQGVVHSSVGADVTYLDRDANIYIADVNEGGGTIISKCNSCDGLIIEGGHLWVYEGGVANSITVNDEGGIHVLSNGLVHSTCMEGATLYVSGGGIANYIVVSDGYIYISSSGVANHITLDRYYRDWGGDLHVSSGGTANDIFIRDGSVHVSSGGTANDVSIWDGSLHISSGGTATIVFTPIQGVVHSSVGADVTYLDRDANIYIVDGNEGGGAIISKCDSCDGLIITERRLWVYEGGVANSTVLEDYGDGRLSVSSGGTAIATSVGTYCSMFVNTGGVANSTTVVTGDIYVNGGVANYTTVNGGWEDDGCLYVLSGGTVNYTAVNNSGYMHVSNGGVANSTTIRSGGVLRISSGGKHTGGLTIAGGVIVSAYAGSIIDFDISAIAPGDAARVNNLSLIQGAPDFTITVSTNQVEGTYALAGGATGFDKTITVLTDIGDKLGTITVGNSLESGDFTYSLVLDGGVLSFAVECAISGEVTGSKMVSSGSVANNVIINSGGELDIVSGGAASATTVNSGGSMYVSSGGVASTTEVTGGGVLDIASGGTASEVTVSSGGGMTVENGGSATQVTVSTGGTLGGFGFDGDKYFGEIANGSATVADQVVIVGNSMYVSSNGAANGITVNDGASMLVSGGGIVADTTVSSGGELLLSSGGKATGTLTITTGAVVSAYVGSIIDFDISAVAADNVVLVNDLSLIQGAPNFTITVSETQPTGTYALAGGAASFAGTITVNANTGNGVGTLTVGGELISGNHIYSLVNDNGTLSLIVTIDTIPPVAPVAFADITAPTNQDVTVTATFSEDSAQKQYSLDNSTWQSYTTGVLMSANGTVYFRGIDAVGNISDVTSYVVSNVDKVAPNKPTASADITAPTNQEVTVTATFSTDSTVKQYSLDASMWVDYTDGVVMSANGTVYFRGIDAAGNVSDVASYEVANINRAAPDRPVASADITAPTNQNVTVMATFSSDSVIKQYSLNGSTWNTYTSGVILSDNGTVYFRGISIEGNVSNVTAYAVTNIDKVAPEKPTALQDITAPTNGKVTVNAECGSDDAIVEYSFDLDTWNRCTTGVVMNDNGTIYFRAVDQAGNVSGITIYSVTNIDKVAPNKPTASANIIAPTNHNVAVSATFSSDTATKQYSLDNSTWQSYTTGVVMSSNGTVYFRGIDEAGNISDMASYEVTNIDKVAPVQPVAAASTTAPTNQNVTVTATFSEDSAQKQYSLDNSTWQSYTTGGVVMTDNGIVYFRGIDEAGNISDMASYEVTNIDKVAPIITLVGDNVSAVHETTLSATVDDGSTLYYRVDGAEWLSYTAPLTVGANAVYEFEATDAAGNTGNVSMTFANILPSAPGNPIGTKETQSWTATGASQYIVEYSTDDFEHVISIVVGGNGIDSLALPSGTYSWRVRSAENDQWTQGENIVADSVDAAPKVVRSDADGIDDVFFASANGAWGGKYAAQHLGSVGDWKGTEEVVSLSGKGRIANFYFGSTDANVLLLTDAANGDALFVDDVFTALPGEVAEQQARLAQIDEIRAGAGDDVIDMTSQRFAYVGDGLTICGGLGDDVIWANKGDNTLFGDAGADRLVGASGNDVLVGGIGDDSMHGGGGNDVFTFCADWGVDTVEQLADGRVTLWFASGSMDNWDAAALTYTDGENSVTVKGVSADRVTLKFGDDGSEKYSWLVASGAFAEFTSEKIFEEQGRGLLA